MKRRKCNNDRCTQILERGHYVYIHCTFFIAIFCFCDSGNAFSKFLNYLLTSFDLLHLQRYRGRAGMFVANHNSWMDIPFMAILLGWRNHKLISKAELEKVPILGKAISTGGHVKVDRSSRKSQIMTLKSGMQWLKVSRQAVIGRCLFVLSCVKI